MKTKITVDEIRSVGDSLRPLNKVFDICYSANHDKIDVMINAQRFEFTTYIEYVQFITGFKFAIQATTIEG